MEFYGCYYLSMPILFQYSGARLTKAYDVTIQRHRNSHAKIEDSKMHFCVVWVQNFMC